MKLRPGNYGKETSFEVRTFDAEMPLDEYARLPKHPLYLVLDNLRSAFNVGSIFRTAGRGPSQRHLHLRLHGPSAPSQARQDGRWAPSRT